MSKIFEITHRDAAARIGKLMLDKEISTPAIIQLNKKDSPVLDSGSLWGKTVLHEPETKKIIILPHKSLPLHTRSEIIKELQFSLAKAQPAAHTGAVVHPFADEYPSSDLYVLGAAKQFENRPREFVDSIIRLKESTRADSLLYAPALATPENLSMLVYMGVDLVDNAMPVIRGYKDRYLTGSGEVYLDRLNEFPCTCAACSSTNPQELIKLPKKERAEMLSLHNSMKLYEELRMVRERIRSGSLREYVEQRCRVKPWLTASLRFIDSEQTFLEKRTPISRSNTLYASTAESLSRVEVRRFAYRVQKRYKAPHLDALVLLPCSAKKPYSLSHSHQKFISALGKYRKYVHEAIITSPLGIVPRELELMYPAAHYDTPVTGYWDREERAWVSYCLKSYLQKNRYEHIIAHVHGAYREICEAVEKTLGLDFVYTAGEIVTTRESLDGLKKAICGLGIVKNRSNEEAKLDMFRAAVDYQFGAGSGELITAGASVRASYPRLQLFAGKQLATLIPQYGTVALTLKGAMRLREHPYYRVRIGDFTPHSSILAPGVVEADPQIRPNDEVIVEGERFFGVGKARMSGWEMKGCTKGVAVELRHSATEIDIYSRPQ